MSAIVQLQIGFHFKFPNPLKKQKLAVVGVADVVALSSLRNSNSIMQLMVVVIVSILEYQLKKERDLPMCTLIVTIMIYTIRPKHCSTAYEPTLITNQFLV